MNLTSKRVIAGLLLAAAFTGVLIKELPWRDDAAKPGVPGLGAAESELGQTQVLVQGETQTDLIDTSLPTAPSEKHKQEIPFAGVPSGAGKAFDSGSKADVPMAAANAQLPDPIATVASKSAPVDSPAAFAPFLAQNNPTPPFSGGGNNGGGGNGGGGSGGGGGNSGNPGGGNPGGGQTPQNPPSNPSDNTPGDSGNPSHPGDNPPANTPPTNPGDNVTSNPPPTGDNPKDPFVPQDPTIDFPKNPDEPNTPTFPPEDPLVPPGGPTTDFPNDPIDPPTHSVPDTGSSLSLLTLALAGMALASRKRFRKVD